MTSGNETAPSSVPSLYTTWSSVKHLSTQGIVDVLLEKGIDVRESLESLLAEGKVAHSRPTVKGNLEKVWKKEVSTLLVDGRNGRLNVHTATVHHMNSMTATKEEKVQAMVDMGGKSEDRLKSARRVFSTFQLYAEYRGLDATDSTDARLPKVIASWLGVIAGIGSEDGDEAQLTASSTMTTQKTLLWTYYNAQNQKELRFNKGWERDDVAHIIKYGVGSSEPPIMKGNPCDSECVNSMVKKITLANRSEIRNVTKQASPMHEVLLRRMYLQMFDDEKGCMDPYNTQLWAMMTISFILCLRSNETLMIRFAHLEFNHVLYPQSLCIRLPWRKQDQTGKSTKPFLLKPLENGLQWLCPVRALRSYILQIDSYRAVDTFGEEFLFGTIQKQTYIPTFDKAMSVESFMHNMHCALANLDVGLIVSLYTLHCFRRGGVQFLDRMNWPLQHIIQWVGWSAQKDCEIDPSVILRYLVNQKQDMFSDLNLTGKGFSVNVNHWPDHFKSELLDDIN